MRKQNFIDFKSKDRPIESGILPWLNVIFTEDDLYQASLSFILN